MGKRRKQICFLFLSLSLALIALTQTIPIVKAQYTNWTWDGVNKILTMISDPTKGGTEALAYGFQDIVDSGVVPAGFYNRSSSGVQFEFDFRIVIGNGVNATWFVDSEKQVTFTTTALSATWQNIIYVRHKGNLRFGILEDASTRRTSRGVNVISLPTYSLCSIIQGQSQSQIMIYSSTFDSAVSIWAIYSVATTGYTVKIYNSLFTRNAILRVQSPLVGEIYNVIIEKGVTALGDGNSPYLSEKIYISDYTDMIGTSGSYSMTLKNLYGIGLTRLAYIVGGWTGTMNLINVESSSWAIFWATGSTTGKVYRQYEFDLTTDANSQIEITYYGQGGGTIFNETDADGIIPTQTISKEFYNLTGGNTPYFYEPFHLKISKDGYQIYEANFTLTQKTSWEITLTPIENMEQYFLLGAVIPFTIGLGLIIIAQKKRNRKPLII